MNALCKALNDPTRRPILALLRKQPLSVSNVYDHFAKSRPGISHQLALLRPAWCWRRAWRPSACW
ncbi:ArsR family transcriptional regulator [Hymenobacter edaphi]|uniref:HTH arsR-type domain-containing protein n=1 Tax=Hymenobacter edaphi TaxID=2211146 RepID=A0A328B474_9BACT|nr:ArsR family transcriptional regulator [Hymenobacter edaphi]RAK62210.1 hypothetical protein DLM85_24225 [Hymenobacter edaphi]